MDTRVKPAYDGLDAWISLCEPPAGLQRHAAQKIFRLHRLPAGALQFENPDGAFLAGDREMIIEHFARRARATGDGAAQDLYACWLAFDRHFAPRAGKWPKPMNMAQHFPCGPVPVDPRLGLFSFCSVADAFVALLC